jgi:hypothetical protein
MAKAAAHFFNLITNELQLTKHESKKNLDGLGSVSIMYDASGTNRSQKPVLPTGPGAATVDRVKARMCEAERPRT